MEEGPEKAARGGVSMEAVEEDGGAIFGKYITKSRASSRGREILQGEDEVRVKKRTDKRKAYGQVIWFTPIQNTLTGLI